MEKPIEFPYQNNSNNAMIVTLAELRDYDILDLITEDDFIKSWIYYQKGDFAHSMLLARDAMDKISPKPDKTDLRWRLVYPLNYYNEVEKYADNTELMMSIIREESFFNPNAQSSVGARGLMQIMPATAKDFAGVSAEELFKPELNIKVGTSYYSRLRGMLNGDDISAVASYNGGIGAINKWLKRFDYADIDEFVEQIPYAETQNYVKKVFRTYWNYLRVYTF
jgi:soluble lytic murein transglycosylase